MFAPNLSVVKSQKCKSEISYHSHRKGQDPVKVELVCMNESQD
jgi:hypothetical protein